MFKESLMPMLAGVVAQLIERSLLTLEVRGSNQVIGNIYVRDVRKKEDGRVSTWGTYTIRVRVPYRSSKPCV